VESSWNENLSTTIGVDFKLKTFTINEQIIKLQIWDTAGQERFRNITSVYYRGAHGIMLVYDCTNLESFQNILKWIDEIHRYAADNVNKILIGNKCDIIEHKVVDSTIAKEFAEKNNMKFIETSAKTCLNVERCFILLSMDILKDNDLQKKGKEETGEKKETIFISNPKKLSSSFFRKYC
jgi:Ras-related protein Rab-1A